VELKSIPDWGQLLIQKCRMAENDLMGLARFADTAEKKEALRLTLEASKSARQRIERNLEARAKRSDPRASRVGRADGRDAGRSAGRLPR
jgi:hypothetical protein